MFWCSHSFCFLSFLFHSYFSPVYYCVDWKREFTFTLNLSVSLSVSKWSKFFVCEAVKNLFKTCSVLSLDWRSSSQNGSCLKEWLRVTMIRSSRAFRSSKTLWWWREAWRGLMDAAIPSYCDLRKTVKLEEYQGLMGVRTSVIHVGIGAPRASGSSRSQLNITRIPHGCPHKEEEELLYSSL